MSGRPIEPGEAKARRDARRKEWHDNARQVQAVRARIDALRASMEDDDELRPLLGPQVSKLRVRAQLLEQRTDVLRSRYVEARAHYDATRPGLDELTHEAQSPGLSRADRARLTARLELARARHDAIYGTYEASSDWVMRQFKHTPVRGWSRLVAELASRRAAENGVVWPPPAPGTGARREWDQELPGATYAALSGLVGADWAAATFSMPEVMTQLGAKPRHPGWMPLLAAHYANLPSVVNGPDPLIALHVAAHTGRPLHWRAKEMIQAVRDAGERATGSDGRHWRVMPLVGLVEVTLDDGDTVTLTSGIVGVDEAHTLMMWDDVPSDLRPD